MNAPLPYLPAALHDPVADKDMDAALFAGESARSHAARLRAIIRGTQDADPRATPEDRRPGQEDRQDAPAPAVPPRGQTGLFAPPTARETVEAARRGPVNLEAVVVESRYLSLPRQASWQRADRAISASVGPLAPKANLTNPMTGIGSCPVDSASAFCPMQAHACAGFAPEEN